MQLISGPLSLFTAKVRVALDEKGIPYERVDVPFGRERGYEPKHEVVLRVNPKAQVPVLVDGDLALYDSTVILEYLEDLKPEPALYPKDAKAKARIRQRELHCDEILFPHVLTLIREIFYQPDESRRDAAKIAEAEAGIRAIQTEFDDALAGREHFGDAFSVADIACFLTLTFAARLGVAPDPSLEHLTDWQARVAARPSISRETAYLTEWGQRVLIPASDRGA